MRQGEYKKNLHGPREFLARLISRRAWISKAPKEGAMHSAAIMLLLLLMIFSIKALILPVEPVPQNLTASNLLPLPYNSSLTTANPTLTYYIPETQTVLYINYFPTFQIPREDLMTAINNIRNRMAHHIEDKGDTWLLPKDDPIIESIAGVESGNWDIIIQSSPVTVHLTYGDVLNVMEGWENLINGQVGPCQMFAAIQNSRRGQIGRLRMFRPGGTMEPGDLLMD